MKKAKSAKRASARAKRYLPAKTVNEYAATVPDAARGMFHELRAAIRSAVPTEATETISYGIPAFKEEKVLVWFAAFSNHCSLFPTASAIAAFKDELKSFPVKKGTIQFPLDKPLPVSLVQKIVKQRVADSKAANKGERHN